MSECVTNQILNRHDTRSLAFNTGRYLLYLIGAFVHYFPYLLVRMFE